MSLTIVPNGKRTAQGGIELVHKCTACGTEHDNYPVNGQCTVCGDALRLN